MQQKPMFIFMLKRFLQKCNNTNKTTINSSSVSWQESSTVKVKYIASKQSTLCWIRCPHSSATVSKTAQAYKTFWGGTEREEVQGAWSMPVANLRQILFVFSTRPHEELMKLSGTVLSSGQGKNQSMAKNCISASPVQTPFMRVIH